MSELKVGDKAVVYDNTGGHQFEIGTVVRIVELYENEGVTEHYFAVPENEEFKGSYMDSGGWWVNDDEVFALTQEEVADIE